MDHILKESPLIVTMTKRPWWRPLCWVTGHRWHVLRKDALKHAGLSNCGVFIGGLDMFCTRCGAEWYDAGMSPDVHYINGNNTLMHGFYASRRMR